MGRGCNVQYLYLHWELKHSALGRGAALKPGQCSEQQTGQLEQEEGLAEGPGWQAGRCERRSGVDRQAVWGAPGCLS